MRPPGRRRHLHARSRELLFSKHAQGNFEGREKSKIDAFASLTEGMKKTESGLYYKITKEGSGSFPKTGAKVSVHYEGKLTDGRVFDSSFQRDDPISFSVGIGQVIKGWDEGIVGMAVGGRRTLTIPPALAYGEAGSGSGSASGSG